MNIIMLQGCHILYAIFNTGQKKNSVLIFLSMRAGGEIGENFLMAKFLQCHTCTCIRYLHMYMYMYSVPELLVIAERGGAGHTYQCLELRYQTHPPGQSTGGT